MIATYTNLAEAHPVTDRSLLFWFLPVFPVLCLAEVHPVSQSLVHQKPPTFAGYFYSKPFAVPE